MDDSRKNNMIDRHEKKGDVDISVSKIARYRDMEFMENLFCAQDICDTV